MSGQNDTIQSFSKFCGCDITTANTKMLPQVKYLELYKLYKDHTVYIK